MEYTLNETLVLKELLGKFIRILYIDDAELERMHDFIFCTQSFDEVMPDDDSEIYDTLDFLRDLANENGFISAEELMSYFREQELVSDGFIESEEKLIPNDHTIDLNFIHDLYAESAGVKLIGYPGSQPVKCYEVIVDNLYQSLNKDSALEYIENSYEEISHIKTKRPHDLWRACGLHTQLLPNTDHIHFNHYYRAFATHEKSYVRVISLLKRFKACFSGLSWKNPFRLPSDIARNHRERVKMEKMYKKIIQSVSEEQPIESNEVQTMLSKIMMIAKFNNPAFMAQHESSAKHLYKQYCQFMKKKKWAVLKSPSGHGWQTTDNPGISIDVDMMTAGYYDTCADPYWKSVNERSVIYFPLSHEYCLRLTPEQNQSPNHHASYIGFEDSSEREFQVINKLAIASQPDVLISAQGIKQRTII
jgi:hypothetical protein